MPQVMVIPSIAADSQLMGLKRRLSSPDGVVHVSGLWGSSAPMVVASVSAGTHRVYLYVTPHLEQADKARDDLELFVETPCRLLPAWETLPGEGPASGEIEAERTRICAELCEYGLDRKAKTPFIVVAPIQALMQCTPSPQALEKNTLRLAVASDAVDRVQLSPDALLDWAIDRGFDRLDLVESPGDVARRGDIVDLFMPGQATPFRLQFFDDEIESIRRFDVSTQRSIENLTSISVSAFSTTPTCPDDSATDLFAYIPSDALIILDAPGEVQEMGELLQTRLGSSERVFEVSDVLSSANRFPQVHLSQFGPARTADEDFFDFRVTSSSRFEGAASEAVGELCRLARDHDVYVMCENEGERERLTELLAEEDSKDASSVRLCLGAMNRGFEWTSTNTIVVPHHEIYHRHRQRRRIRRVHAARPLETWTDLKAGDFVVHVVHGIAVYRGLKFLRKGSSDQQEEFLTLEFADKAVIHVPCSQVELVQKYIGAGGRNPRVSTLGGKRWNKAKEQVGEAVADLAESLLRIQAARSQERGTAYPPDTQWQREFEAAFQYQETEDQLLVASQIRDDLLSSRPMDRLICGDVGYGKTELAMRAAFKVVEYGKQVAVLVPTTVLAEQHYRTFLERMAEFPFTIGCLSRFRSGAEQRKLIGQVKKGQIDILIGTHRLLSKDVSFANLGLLVVDEEQRFGVEHKEVLKSLRETIDVITLTATPIPRTLHMSLVGIKDISSLQTPPVDRRAIRTEVRQFDEGLIRDAILRELNRDGQVFFIHNFVHSIAAMADTVQQIVPEAKVVFAHGQMKDGQLEDVMSKFVMRQSDVLVCTTIIESGIDIPTVNTIFINRADRFGLADMHQLRGRVGRSDQRAYCYLLLSPDRSPTSKAAKRLKTIEEFSELGSGFRIAMRDLEIRGAGNLLGREQSGHIALVGYEMYCRLLEQTVRRLKNEPDPTPPTVHVDLEVAAHIPAHYIVAERSRIEIYRRIAGCGTVEDLEQLMKDLVDAFGPFPSRVQRLLDLSEIRIRSREYGIASISLRPPDVIFVVDRLTQVEPLFKNAPGTVRTPDSRTVHMRPPAKYLNPGALIPLLKQMLTYGNMVTETTA